MKLFFSLFVLRLFPFFFQISPYKSLSAPAYERDGMPPFRSLLWRTPHLNNNNTTTTTTTTTTPHLNNNNTHLTKNNMMRTPHLNNNKTYLTTWRLLNFQSFPLTQLSMSSVPQSRWKTNPRTRRHRLENELTETSRS